MNSERYQNYQTVRQLVENLNSAMLHDKERTLLLQTSEDLLLCNDEAESIALQAEVDRLLAGLVENRMRWERKGDLASEIQQLLASTGPAKEQGPPHTDIEPSALV